MLLKTLAILVLFASAIVPAQTKPASPTNIGTGTIETYAGIYIDHVEPLDLRREEFSLGLIMSTTDGVRCLADQLKVNGIIVEIRDCGKKGRVHYARGWNAARVDHILLQIRGGSKFSIYSQFMGISAISTPSPYCDFGKLRNL